MRDMTYDVLVTAVSHPMRMDAGRLRHLYDWCVMSSNHIGKLPNTFSAKGGGFTGKKYLEFGRGRKRLEATDFSALSYLNVAAFRQKQNSMTIGWEFQARSLDKHVVVSSSDTRWEPTGWWEASVCISPDLLEIAETACVELAADFVRLTVDEYGYVFFMHRNRGPVHYAMGMGYEAVQYPNDRTYDESANISNWSTDVVRRLTRPWLRDVYPLNFLGPQIAAMLVEGKPLAEWLRANPTWGSIEPFPCERETNVMLWRPPLEQIPALRERLYRAGLIWHRQYNYGPFTPQDPPPEIMRGEFYAGRDPKLTR